MSMTRLSGLAALSFVTIVAVINIALGAAGWPPESGQVVAYFADHATLIGLDVALSLANAVLIAVFGAGAFAMIWRVERDRGEAWSVVGLIGVAVMIPLFSTVVGIRAALVHDPAGGLWNLHNALFTATGMGLGTILVGFSVGGWRTATIQAWHGILGLVSGSLLIVAGALTPVSGLAAVGLIGFIGWLVWLAAFGLVLLRRS